MPPRSTWAAEWRKIPLKLADLSIDTTLRCGQSFRWRKFGNEWVCTLRGRVVRLRQDETALYYQAVWPAHKPVPKDNEDDTERLIRHYLSLDVDLQALYREWSAADSHFKKLAENFCGIRILSQDAWEALVSFICSSNNNISRISQMVQKLCIEYGPFVAKIGDEVFHDFPSPEEMAGEDVEATLRALGFGYRARYLADTAKNVASKPKDWLNNLRNPENPSYGSSITNPDATYKQAHKELLKLKGVGPKVSDCVCLMGLSWGESVPVDTHVWQIAVRDYNFGKGKPKAFALSMYEPVGDLFRDLWGSKAGWAHSVLFTADLRSFSDQKAATSSKTTVKKEEIKDEPDEDKMEVEYQPRKRKNSTEPPATKSIKKSKRELAAAKHVGASRVKIEACDDTKIKAEDMDIDMMTPEPERPTRRSARLRGVKMEE
ncbi:N-glycosylase/DNA lyase [Ceratocystis lukuohia]|uniref:DNA-(apurinic or apyrimidinic site) lyase n=1 Tax=Ceratocystis lukuohia TaxID=2019550 RepID=A0ABR4MAX8_9PEZI